MPRARGRDKRTGFRVGVSRWTEYIPLRTDIFGSGRDITHDAPDMNDKRIEFDFEVDFSNGGGIQGQGFRLDLDGDAIDDDDALAAFIVRDLRLLMVGAVRI